MGLTHRDGSGEARIDRVLSHHLDRHVTRFRPAPVDGAEAPDVGGLDRLVRANVRSPPRHALHFVPPFGKVENTGWNRQTYVG